MRRRELGARTGPGPSRTGAIVAFAFFAVTTPCASAATVAVSPGAITSTRDLVGFDAASGERNRVTVQPSPDPSTPGSWVISDAGAPLVAGRSCTTLDEHTARCDPLPQSEPYEAHQLSESRLALGDLDDELIVSPGFSSQVFLVGVRAGLGDDTVRAAAPAAVHGGAGNDELVGGQAGVRLYGGPGDDRLVGGPNSDQLDGGGGRDELHGGAGDDQLTDGDRDGVAGAGGPGPDILDGGTEAHVCCAFSIGDEVSYARRQASVTVDVAHRERDGERGEGDVVSDVESVIGGHGPDRLAGSNTRNRLMGQGGRDVLIGRGGPDELSNGGGPVSCGPGRDLIRFVSSRDQLDRDCEQLELNATYPLLGPRLPPYPKMERGRTAVFTFTCPYRDGDLDDPPDPSSDYCGGALTLREATGRHRLLGRATFRPGNWLYLGLRVALGPLGRAAIARPTGVWATVSLAGRNLDPPTSWSILLGRSVSPSG